MLFVTSAGHVFLASLHLRASSWLSSCPDVPLVFFVEKQYNHAVIIFTIIIIGVRHMG